MLILVTGGSGSGKSEYAEFLVLKLHRKPYLYLATMYPFDEECDKRIERHRKMRKAKEFTTLECYTNIAKADVKGYRTVLLECMSNLVANEIYQDEGAKEHTIDAVLDGVKQISGQCEHLIIVTNEIFSDGHAYEKETVRYQRYLGEINQRLAELADVVVEVAYSVPLLYKGSLEGVLT